MFRREAEKNLDQVIFGTNTYFRCCQEFGERFWAFGAVVWVWELQARGCEAADTEGSDTRHYVSVP